MINKSIETEKNYWNSHVVDEGELRYPYTSLWDLYRWETIFYRITSEYDFNNKTVFVGGCGSGIFEEWLVERTKIKK